ncbi:hypothetical protein BC629DRAFT_1581129 [Irpex lacteus]|nr:hypothetical protein BC629DRAFT_1581129 [Irpex lacteus]
MRCLISVAVCEEPLSGDVQFATVHVNRRKAIVHVPRPSFGPRISISTYIYRSHSDEQHGDAWNIQLPFGKVTGDLTSCALVCKDWAFAAQELLFRRVTLRSEDAFDSFATAVRDTSPRGRALAATVKRMHCIVDDKQPRSLSMKAFTQAITLYPMPSRGVAGMDPADRSVPSALVFDDNVLSALRNCPRISTLRFDNWSNDETALVQLLQNLPSVTALAISGKTPSLPPSLLEPLHCTLQEVRLNFQTTPASDFLEWLLQNSKGVLRALEFQREPSIALLEYLISEHCDTLESLALPACASQEGAALLARCIRLRELHLENAWVAPGVRRVLPSTLERLALAVDKETPLQPVVQAIKRSEALSSITLQMWAEGERHPQLAAVKIACATRGIHLKVMRDIRVFRTIKRGYPIHGVTFNCSNLHILNSSHAPLRCYDCSCPMTFTSTIR